MIVSQMGVHMLQEVGQVIVRVRVHLQAITDGERGVLVVLPEGRPGGVVPAVGLQSDVGVEAGHLSMTSGGVVMQGVKGRIGEEGHPQCVMILHEAGAKEEHLVDFFIWSHLVTVVVDGLVVEGVGKG